MRSIEFLEQLLRVAKPNDVEFLITLLFEVKKDIERGKKHEND